MKLRLVNGPLTISTYHPNTGYDTVLEVFSVGDANCDYIDGIIQVVGTAFDANMGIWVLQYAGGNTTGWITIGSGNGDVVHVALGT